MAPYTRCFLGMCVCWLCVQPAGAVTQVLLLNAPQEPEPGHILRVLYSCDQPATVRLDCVVSFDTGLTSTHLLGRWSCVPRGPRTRSLELKLPDWLVYQADGMVPEAQWVLSLMLLASLTHPDHGSVTAKDAAALQPKAFFDRPVKQHQLCTSWGAQMSHFTRDFSQKQCPSEQETVHLLSSIFASTGENFGITKTLEPYVSPSLEYLRVNALSFPWCTVSMWVYVSRPCQARLCGLFHHIDSHDNYASPTLFLLNSGQLHVQMDGESGDSTAFHPHFHVPLGQWCRISVTLQGSLVTVAMLCVDRGQRTVRSVDRGLRHAVLLNDTDGYFVIGGGRYIRGVEGYFGPVVYYRNRISDPSTAEAALPHVLQAVDLPGWLHACQAFRLEMTMRVKDYSLNPGTCVNPLHEWMVKHGQQSRSQCGLWEAYFPHRKRAGKLIQALALKRGGGGVTLPAVARALFSSSLHRLSRTSRTAALSRTVAVLLQAGCLAEPRALHLSSVLYASGLGVSKQPSKAWLLALLAAQQDDRLALLHLGYMHHRGRHGLPADQDLAYAYYANIAKQTTVDRLNHTPSQTFVEAVYLHNDEVLNAQTSEDHHIFQWLKLQARRGTADAEQAVGRMLFWGQQGVAPNIQEAVRHYERGAVHLEDPQLMYDYGIVLLQGQGVEKDIPRAVKFLKKAVDKGFVSAFSALGWYYEHFEKDYERAVQLWEQGDLLQCPDAALNLGVMYSQGRYPGKAANQSLAYQYYQKAAHRGQVRAATLVADMWTTGIPGHVTRRPLDAVLWVKWAAEHNGYLGTVLRKALDSYLQSDTFSSLLYYMMAAESGYAPALFNVAYLCDQNTLGFLDPTFASDCVWTYYNLTVQSQNPDTYAFIRMGDLLYEGRSNRSRDLVSAAEMYKRAALRSEPQGWYNLGLLAAEGFRLPMSILIELGLPQLYLAENSSLLSTLYIRCRDSGDADSYLPCSLALYHVQLQAFQKDYGAAIKVFTAVAVVAAPTLLFIILAVFRRLVPAHS